MGKIVAIAVVAGASMLLEPAGPKGVPALRRRAELDEAKPRRRSGGSGAELGTQGVGSVKQPAPWSNRCVGLWLQDEAGRTGQGAGAVRSR